ncbi:MAG: hypothetical protein JWO54_857 [Candidatus Saccharibacteria bacterium]|nr:hypothetical protein [Candidatus Saccharibacteria bacterium]
MGFGGNTGGGSAISGASDVAFNNTQNGQTLSYDGTTQKWENTFASSGNTPGIVQLDSFAGANDDAKLTAALDYVQNQTFMPAIQLPARIVTFSQTRTPFSGLKIIGPGPGSGPKNLELSSGKFTYGRVSLNVGTGTNAWWYGTGTYYDIYFGNVAIQYPSGGQFWHQPSGTLYACEFHSLTHYGANHVFGTPAAKALMTQVLFSGHWTCLGLRDVQFTIGGSDNTFWMAGYINIGPGSATLGNGRYQMVFDTLGKSNIGDIYVTSEWGWRGVKISGSGSGLTLNAPRLEGRNASTPCDGNVLRITGGNGVTIVNPWIAYGMDSPDPTEHGMIEVTGGNVFIDRPVYNRGTAATSVPLVYCSGGKVEVRYAASSTNEVMYVDGAGGTVLTDSSVSVV